jgi:hypothetical protein
MLSEKRADPKAVLRDLAVGAAGAAQAPGDGPHIGSKRLIAYRLGTLPAAEREAVQEHLSLCARCTGLLRELREFEADAAEGATGPEPLREEAWAALVRRLPPKAPAIRPVAGAGRPDRQARQTRQARQARQVIPGALRTRSLYAAAAALLLAIGGLATWESVSVRQERQRLAHLEQRLEQREEALATVQSSQEETRRQLDAARARIHDLETDLETKPAPDPGRAKREAELAGRVAELTSEVEGLRRAARAPQDRIASVSSGVEVSLSPRFVLRGAESPGGEILRGGGAANRVKPQADRVSVALDLADFSTSPEVRFELADRSGKVLWSGSRPGDTLVGDDGTLAVIQGLAPGRYRLRIEGLPPDSAALRAEYLLDVEE